MVKALAIKELRESLGLIVLGLIGAVGVVGPLMGVAVVPWKGAAETWNPFVNEMHLEKQGFLLGIFAFVLGLKQTAWEIHQGTFRYLLHRPISRNKVFLVKLLIGTAAIVAVNGFMILLYAWWSATPGNHPSPFFWSMTYPSWQLALSLLIVYLSAFLSGVRQARWIGTRLVPVALGGACVYVINTSQAWWWYSLLLGLPSAVAMLIAIFYYIHHSDQ
ncbi:MAG: hypothetical protein MI725_08725 [Pirellulales bacterium]|nr:hypothetical protein [Pirellulales bacterium]